MDRKPFTITMKKDLIKKVDSLIDGTRIRNRSHALEYIVSLHFKPKVNKALILAGGEGVKMRPFTYELPKTMLPVKGRPILEYQIDLLRDCDIREIYIAIGYLSGKIKEHFGDGSKFGVRIYYIEEKKNLGTGGAIKSAIPYLSENPFVLFWGDELIDIDLWDLIGSHLEDNPIITMALTSTSDPTDYGAVKIQGDTLVEFKEKPKKAATISHLVSAGVYVVSPKIVDYMPTEKSLFSVEEEVFPKLIKENKVKGYLFDGQWFDVGTPEIYQRAIKEWRK